MAFETTGIAKPKAHRIGADSVMTLSVPEAASQSFVAGDLVYRASGALTICGDNPAKILGIALEDATGVTGTMLLVAVFTATSWVTMQIDSTTTATKDLDLDYVGADYGIKLTGALWAVDIDQGTTRLRIQDNIDPVGTANAKVKCSIDADVREVP